jgi:hypothetical protein
MQIFRVVVERNHEAVLLRGALLLAATTAARTKTCAASTSCSDLAGSPQDARKARIEKAGGAGANDQSTAAIIMVRI